MPMRMVAKSRELAIAPQAPYSEGYIEQCFWAWYSANQPVGTKMVSIMPEDEHGRVPTATLLSSWKKDKGWLDRAKELDEKVTREIEQRTISARVDMLDRHAQMARKMAEQGMEWLKNNKIDSSSSAVRAITEGIRLERESLGVATAIKNIAGKQDDQLITIITNLLDKAGKSGPAEIDEIIEGEFSDVDPADDD